MAIAFDYFGAIKQVIYVASILWRLFPTGIYGFLTMNRRHVTSINYNCRSRNTVPSSRFRDTTLLVVACCAWQLTHSIFKNCSEIRMPKIAGHTFTTCYRLYIEFKVTYAAALSKRISEVQPRQQKFQQNAGGLFKAWLRIIQGNISIVPKEETHH